MKSATSNLAYRCGLPRPIMKSHLKKKWVWPGLGELPEIWGFPFIISATAEPSDFKFGTQLGFAKSHHKITPTGKSGDGLGLRELLNILGFLYISATAGDSDFKFGTQLGFTKTHAKVNGRVMSVLLIFLHALWQIHVEGVYAFKLVQ